MLIIERTKMFRALLDNLQLARRAMQVRVGPRPASANTAKVLVEELGTLWLLRVTRRSKSVLRMLNNVDVRCPYHSESVCAAGGSSERSNQGDAQLAKRARMELGQCGSAQLRAMKYTVSLSSGVENSLFRSGWQTQP